ncbi:MAG TPA: S8 family serine peptidase [Planctomycetota bacterium]|nr:S8 family serine peptidase [Planctomycetota bacterium]
MRSSSAKLLTLGLVLPTAILLPGCWPGIPITLLAESSDSDGGSGGSPEIEAPDPLFASQWHLENTGQLGGVPGQDANVVPAWKRGFLGSGRLIAVVDDGVEIGHEDLAANVLPGASHNYANGSSDPSPPPKMGDELIAHGTSVAGVAAGRGQNGIGISGAAPRATLVGYNFLAPGSPGDTATMIDAMTRNAAQVSVSNNSWGPSISGFPLPFPTSFHAAIQTGLDTGRGGLGVIYLFAAGNSGNFCGPGTVSPGDMAVFGYENTNNSGIAQNRGIMHVAAIGDDGVVANYSTGGATVWVGAHSRGNNARAITTTDRTGFEGYNPNLVGSDHADLNYTNTFNGTSSACPLAAGVVALMLSANPGLTWRDVRVLLARSARPTDLGHPGWTTNGAGHPYNHRYGFGVVDAEAAVDAALAHAGLASAKQVSQTSDTFLPIPDNDLTGVSDSISFAGSGIADIEWVSVTFSAADHTWFADLRIVLRSPSGMQSTLAWPHALIDPSNPCNGSDPGGITYLDWVFGAAGHLDEGADGLWTLTVSDEAGGDVGTFQTWTLTVHGH